MSRVTLMASATVAAALAFSTGLSTAHASPTQPADLGNVENIVRGASLQGPHCHFVLPADGKGKYARIITGAAHQAHNETGLSDGIFAATACSESDTG